MNQLNLVDHYTAKNVFRFAKTLQLLKFMTLENEIIRGVP